MDFKKLNATWQSAIYSNRLLLIANAGLAITVVLLSFKLSQSHERLIIVPPTVNDRYELDWHGATAEYYKDIALWLSGTMGAVSRSNVDYVTNVVNRFMDPRPCRLFRNDSSSTNVFLDEIGELPAEVQVKLLRVLQGRQFQRVGDNNSRTFYGKIISATHRDLAAAIEAGKFRSDLYYRLCSDIIRTPSLADQLADNKEELYHLVTLVTGKIVNADMPTISPKKRIHGLVNICLITHGVAT